MIEEPNEGVPPGTERWKILRISQDEDPLVTFQAGAATFTCYKSGKIYQAWEQESRRQAHGGPVAAKNPYGASQVVFTEGKQFGRAWEEQPVMSPPVAAFVDSQLEEREHRIGDLRKKAIMLDWCDHEKGVCTGKCTLLDEIRSIEKKILGDP